MLAALYTARTYMADAAFTESLVYQEVTTEHMDILTAIHTVLTNTGRPALQLVIDQLQQHNDITRRQCS